MQGRRKIGVDPPGVNRQCDVPLFWSTLDPASLSTGFIIDTFCPECCGIEGQASRLLDLAIAEKHNVQTRKGELRHVRLGWKIILHQEKIDLVFPIDEERRTHVSFQTGSLDIGAIRLASPKLQIMHPHGSHACFSIYKEIFHAVVIEIYGIADAVIGSGGIAER